MNQIITPITEHSHVMGGSTAAQRINCPGSYQLEKKMPPKPESEYATRGSMLHAAMELIVTEDPKTIKEAEKLFEELIGQDLGFGEDHIITAELVETKIRPATMAWLALVEKHDFEDWFIEQRVHLDHIIPGAFGTADIIAKDKNNALHILDWKFGDGVAVEVEGNYGLGFYAAAALYDSDQELRKFTENIRDDSLFMHIVQPRVGSHEVLHTWETDTDWIEKLVDLAEDSYNTAVKTIDEPVVKAGSWCRWCAAKPICPAHEQLACDALSKEPAAMSSVELADALKKAELLKSWVADVFKLAQREAEGGANIPGWKLVQKQPERKWTDPKEVEKILKRRKVKVGDMYERQLISPTQAEKAFPRVYSKVLADHVHLHTSGLTLVPESDKRKAMVSSMNLLANAIDKQQTETGESKDE